MTRKASRPRRRYGSLFEAIAAGDPDGVRQLLADGADPNYDGVEEAGDITPLMEAAASGELAMVQLLVAAGADVNTLAEDLTGELDRFPYLDGLFQTAALWGMTALAYAAVYGHREVYDDLAPLTEPTLRAQAEAIVEARRVYLDSLDPARRGKATPPRRPKVSARQAARDDLLATRPGLRRWLNECPLCGRRGYKPELPAEIDRRGSAAQLRRHFRPLPLNADRLCGVCARKVEAGQRKIEARRLRRSSTTPHGAKADPRATRDQAGPDK
jgi:hypothetical protein